MKIPEKLNLKNLESYFNYGRTMCHKVFLDETPERVEAVLRAAFAAEVRRISCRNVQFNDDQDACIKQVAQWLSQPQGRPGLLLMGTCGNGKTTLMTALCNLMKLMDDWKRSEQCGGYAIRTGMVSACDLIALCHDSKSYHERLHRFEQADILCIDDLGEEPQDIMSYGSKLTPVIDVLMYRYDRRKTTLITTNLRPREISDKYGERIADRFEEFLEPVIFKSSSFRKLPIGSQQYALKNA